MLSELPFAGQYREGSVDFTLDGATVIADVFSVPTDGDGPRDTTRIEATPEQADAMADAWREWAALARARRQANDPLPLFGFLP